VLRADEEPTAKEAQRKAKRANRKLIFIHTLDSLGRILVPRVNHQHEAYQISADGKMFHKLFKNNCVQLNYDRGTHR
jgi:hypothetical protein